MARRLFFSFHFERDVWRVQQVRQSWRFTDLELPTFYNATQWEDVKRGGDAAIKKFINDGISRATCTVLLVGAQTASRDWVKYEIQESYKADKGLVTVYIHDIKNQSQQTDTRGVNPLSNFQIEQGGQKVLLSSLFKAYDWVSGNGRDNIHKWVEEAITIRKSLNEPPKPPPKSWFF